MPEMVQPIQLVPVVVVWVEKRQIAQRQRLLEIILAVLDYRHLY